MRQIKSHRHSTWATIKSLVAGTIPSLIQGCSFLYNTDEPMRMDFM